MIILASASPRRQALLDILNIEYKVCIPQADENLPDNISPRHAVELLAERKAGKVFYMYPQEIVLAADTLVVKDGNILGKPKSEKDAFSMLSMLSGSTHQVYTGVCVMSKTEKILFHEKTDVYFYPLNDDDIRSYICTGEPMDKAGAYGIQGKGCLFVKSIKGDFYNVMGLPIARVARILQQLK